MVDRLLHWRILGSPAAHRHRVHRRRAPHAAHHGRQQVSPSRRSSSATGSS
jgi:hypothetical protein